MKIIRYFKEIFGKVAVTALTVGTLSFSANATYSDWYLEADSGSYSPLALGQDLQVDACASTLNNSNTGASYGICDLPSLNDFRINWYAYNGDTRAFQLLATFDNSGQNGNPAASEGVRTSFATGVGTFFSSPSNFYYIGVRLIAEAGAYIDLPGGGEADIGAHTIHDFDWSSHFAVEPAAVSEPLAALLLAPGLLLMARRHRKKKRTASTV